MNTQAMINSQVKHSKVFDLRSLQRTCAGCAYGESCLSGQLSPAARAQLAGIVRRPHTLHRGEHLFWPGGKFESIYVLRSGAVKTYILDQSGTEQITGFYNPGDWIGLDAFGKGAHPSVATALADTALCAIPFAEIDKLCASEPILRQHLWRSLSQATQDSQAHAMLLADKPAEQRIATFLVELCDRKQNSGLAAEEFDLNMSRADIANFLGLATETVSRWFTRLQQLNLIIVNGRRIALCDSASLRRIAVGLNARDLERQGDVHFGCFSH